MVRVILGQKTCLALRQKTWMSLRYKRRSLLRTHTCAVLRCPSSCVLRDRGCVVLWEHGCAALIVKYIQNLAHFEVVKISNLWFGALQADIVACSTLFAYTPHSYRLSLGYLVLSSCSPDVFAFFCLCVGGSPSLLSADAGAYIFPHSVEALRLVPPIRVTWVWKFPVVFVFQCWGKGYYLYSA